MMALSVFEHEWLPIGQANGCRLSDEQAAVLERLEPSLPAGTLEWRRKSVKFAQFCGIVQIGVLTIEVLPKIARVDEDAVRSRSLLVRMLRNAGLFEPTAVGQTTVSLQRNHLLDLFIDHFRAEVQSQLWHGMLRRYVPQEESLPRVRGRIDLKRQLVDNHTTPQVMACRYEELEQNNRINQSLVYVLRLLLERANDRLVRQRLEELISRFAGVSPVPVTADQMEEFRFQRSESRWEPVFRQAQLFLKGLYPDVLSGNAPALALLFDMNRLFESFVAIELRKNMRKDVVREQGPVKYLASDSVDRQAFRLRPDITVTSQEGKLRVIVDTKWKLLDARLQRNIRPSDIYQMLSYAHRYGCDTVVLVYPICSDTQVFECLEKYHIQESQITVRVHGFDLRKIGETRVPELVV